MKIVDTFKGKSAIRASARRAGVPLEIYRKEIQAAIDAAWESADPEIRRRQRELFPEGKPSPEHFIVTVAKLTRV